MAHETNAISNSVVKKAFAAILAVMILLAFMPMVNGNASAASKPAKVSGVSATADTANQVTVTWSKAKKAKKYKVNIVDNTTSFSVTKTVKKLTYTFQGQTSTKYTVKVRGIKGKKKGKWSTAVDVTTNGADVTALQAAVDAAKAEATAAKAAQAEAEAAAATAKTNQEAAEKEAAAAKAEAAAATQNYNDAKAALDMVVAIDALPATITSANASTVTALKAEYDALTDTAKALVPEDYSKELTSKATEANKVTEQAKANAVYNEIVKLPSTVTEASDVKLTAAQIEAIKTASTDYNALSDDTKKLVASTAVDKLNTLLSEVAALDVIDTINKLPAAASIKATDASAVTAARSAYDNYLASYVTKKGDNNNDATNYVTSAAQQKLAQAESAIKAVEAGMTTEQKAQVVIDQINALPAASAVSTSDKTAIEAAEEAYGKLTDAEKKVVDEKTATTNSTTKTEGNQTTITTVASTKLKDVRTALDKALDKANENAAKAVDAQIAKITYDASGNPTDATAVTTARTAYDKYLKDYVKEGSNNSYEQDKVTKASDLTYAENILSNARINAYTEAVKAIPEISEVNYNSSEVTKAIKAAANAYDALTKDEKGDSKVENAKATYDAAIEAIDKFTTAAGMTGTVNTINNYIQTLEQAFTDKTTKEVEITAENVKANKTTVDALITEYASFKNGYPDVDATQAGINDTNVVLSTLVEAEAEAVSDEDSTTKLIAAIADAKDVAEATSTAYNSYAELDDVAKVFLSTDSVTMLQKAVYAQTTASNKANAAKVGEALQAISGTASAITTVADLNALKAKASDETNENSANDKIEYNLVVSNINDATTAYTAYTTYLNPAKSAENNAVNVYEGSVLPTGWYDATDYVPTEYANAYAIYTDLLAENFTALQ